MVALGTSGNVKLFVISLAKCKLICHIQITKGHTGSEAMQMTTIILVNEIDQAKLEGVKAEMATLGSPTIRAIDGGDHLIAIEGSHRLRAAEELGLPVNIQVIGDEADIDLDTLDWDDNNWFDERVVSGREFIEGFTRSPFPMSQPTAHVEVAA